MARVAGVDLPPNKRAEVGLTYIYWHRPLALKLEFSTKAAVNLDTRVRDLSEDELSRIRAILEAQGEIEGDLRKRIQMDIKRLMDIGCYRGLPTSPRVCRFVVSARTPTPELARVRDAQLSPRRRRQGRNKD